MATDSFGKWLTLLLPAGMALGAAFTGFVSDKVFHGRWHLPIILLMGVAALIAMGLGLTAKTNLVISGCLLLAAGFCVYGPQAAFWSLAQQIGGPLRGSSATGLMDASAYIFAAAGEIMIGRVVDFAGTTGFIFPVIATTCALSSLFMLPLVRWKAGNVAGGRAS